MREHVNARSIELWAMHASMSHSWQTADILHYIYFSTCRPTNCWKIITHHPKRWPEPLSKRNFNICFDESVSKTKMTQGAYTSRRILAGAIPALICPRIVFASLKH